jgi:hypothetical protein
MTQQVTKRQQPDGTMHAELFDAVSNKTVGWIALEDKRPAGKLQIRVKFIDTTGVEEPREYDVEVGSSDNSVSIVTEKFAGSDNVQKIDLRTQDATGRGSVGTTTKTLSKTIGAAVPVGISTLTMITGGNGVGAVIVDPTGTIGVVTAENGDNRSVTTATTNMVDATADHKGYIRKDNAWVQPTTDDILIPA